MKLKRYKDYIKENSFSTDLIEDEDIDLIDNDIEDTDIEDIDNTLSSDNFEEEEVHEYEGEKKMRELSDKLGTELINGSIDYNGNIINYYSETESFHIGKEKFKTIDEVLQFLNK